MNEKSKTNGNKVAGKAKSKPQPAARGTSKVAFNTSELKSSYCNVCNGSSTREEVVINFGVNENWDMGRVRIEVALQHRIVMSPHAAKRVRDMMIRLIEEHETRYGKLEG
ncbi:MAG: DUF3467 domain-containing protein [Sulfitobacter sp.]|nr:DUF3467 domain-containing protein [Sulfitobacter sp.]